MGEVPAFFSKLQKDCGAVIAALAAKQKVETTIYAGDPYLHWITGGFSLGKVNIVYGVAGCLDENTYIRYYVVDSNGRNQNMKGGTIKHLYERFHHRPVFGKGYYQRHVSKNSSFYIQSMDDEGRFFRNRIENVFYNGIQTCYKIITRSGLELIATKDHKFFTGETYVCLEQLKIGDKICVHGNVRKTKLKRNNYQEYFVKYHPLRRTKIVKDSYGNSYVYCRIKKSRAVIEANLNNMSVENYIVFLNQKTCEEIDRLNILPNHIQIHHLNEDCTDNSLENLIMTTCSEHTKMHMESSTRMRYSVCVDYVESIIPVGERETYDIQCQSPYNNYIANKFVVHNSGKSTLSLNIIGRTQQLRPGSWVLIIDSEMYFQDRPDRMQRLQDSFGIDISHCLIITSKQLNVAFGNIFDFIEAVKKKEIELSGVLIDSWKGFENKSAVKKIIEGKIDEASDSSRGNAKAMNPILDQIVILASLSRASCFITQHCAQNQEQYGPDYLLPGGENLRHQADAIIYLETINSSGAKLAEGDEIIAKSDYETEKIGKQIRARADKTRNTVEGKKCEFWFNFKEGRFALPERSLFDLAVRIGVIYHPTNEEGKVNNASWQFEDIKVHGQDNMIEKIKTDKDFFNRIQAACFPSGESVKKETVKKVDEEKPKKKMK